MIISDFESPPDSTIVRWSCDQKPVVKQYAFEVQGAILKSGTGVAIAEPSNGNPHNGVIYNADGSLRVRLVNPCVADGAICFGDVYCDGSELKFIARGPGFMWACVFDENGQLLRTHETR